MNRSPNDLHARNDPGWIRESPFGRWFLGTEIWYRYVLRDAVAELCRMLDAGSRENERILDAGCGIGRAFSLLEQHFHPRLIVAVDIDRELLDDAAQAARGCRCQVVVESAPVAELDYPDESFEMIFCHQLLHHTADQRGALRAFHRLLVPGGVALIGESCRAFIRRLPVRILFKHPMAVQKSAGEYVELVRSAGFEVRERNVKAFTPWWSRRDLGLLGKLGSPLARSRQATEVLMVARKPDSESRG